MKKHISKRGLGIAAVVAVAASVIAGPAMAGSSDNRADGSVRIGTDRISIDHVKGDRDEAKGEWRYTDGTNTVYGTPLCVTGTEDGPGNTVAIALWFHRSNFPGGSDFAQGKFGLHYVQEKSGADASRFFPATGSVSCPTQGFTFASIPAALVEVTSRSYDVKVKD